MNIEHLQQSGLTAGEVGRLKAVDELYGDWLQWVGWLADPKLGRPAWAQGVKGTEELRRGLVAMLGEWRELKRGKILGPSVAKAMEGDLPATGKSEGLS